MNSTIRNYALKSINNGRRRSNSSNSVKMNKLMYAAAERSTIHRNVAQNTPQQKNNYAKTYLAVKHGK